MSAILQLVPPRDSGGYVLVTVQAGAPAYFHNGLPYEADGTIAAQYTDAAYYHQGLGFAGSGRLCIFTGDPTYRGSGAAGFALDGRLCKADSPDALVAYANGVAYDADGSFGVVVS